ncbi:MAG: periplasmic heavy metal sensor [Myxococcales bacterium]
MFGIIIGTLCLLGLIHVLRRGRWHHGYGHGCGGHHGGYGLGGPRFWLRRTFERLGTSAAQEKVIVEAANELHEHGGKLWTEFAQSKADLAEALRAEPMDSGKVQAAFARHDSLMADLRKATVDALGKIHAVLDPEQRKRLAQMIERPHGFGFGHHACC